jgi:type I restriction enzyme S subunit
MKPVTGEGAKARSKQSRIEALIAELCPEGVEFKEIQELFITKNGYTPSTTNKAYWTAGTVPWFRMEDIRENGRILSTSLQQITPGAVKGGRLFPANSIIVATSATIGEHALITVPHLSNQRFTSLALKPGFAGRLDMKFAFYYCFVLDNWCRNNTTTSSFASVDMTGFKKFRFPIPPLEIQREIVKVLDSFTQLEAELEAELEARRRQYDYYRNRLLEFGQWKMENGEGRTGAAQGTTATSVRWATLGEIGEFIRGRRFTKADYVENDGIPCIHYGDIYTQYGTTANKVKTHVRSDMRGTLRFAKHGDVVITDVGETVEDVGKPVAWLGEEDVAIHDHCYAFRHSMNATFVAYCMQTSSFIAEKAKYVARTKVNTLLMNGFAKIRIPIPPLEEQERIVAVLDQFDALVNDLKSGLPAEIAARRKQYAYYRDRLLSFREAA